MLEIFQKKTKTWIIENYPAEENTGLLKQTNFPFSNLSNQPKFKVTPCRRWSKREYNQMTMVAKTCLYIETVESGNPHGLHPLVCQGSLQCYDVMRVCIKKQSYLYTSLLCQGDWPWKEEGQRNLSKGVHFLGRGAEFKNFPRLAKVSWVKWTSIKDAQKTYKTTQLLSQTKKIHGKRESLVTNVIQVLKQEKKADSKNHFKHTICAGEKAREVYWNKDFSVSGNTNQEDSGGRAG